MNSAATNPGTSASKRLPAWCWLIAALVAAVPLALGPAATFSSSEASLLGMGEPGLAGIADRWRAELVVAGWSWSLVTAALWIAATWSALVLGHSLGLSAATSCAAACLFAASPLAVETLAWRGALAPLAQVALTLAGFALWSRARRSGKAWPAWLAVLVFAAASIFGLSAAWLALWFFDRAMRDERQPAVSLRAPAVALVALALARFVAGSLIDASPTDDLDLTGFAIDGGRESLLRLELWSRGLWLTALPIAPKLLHPIDPHATWSGSTATLQILTVVGALIALAIAHWRGWRLAAAASAWWLLVPAAFAVEPDLLGGPHGAHPLRDATIVGGTWGVALLVAIAGERRQALITAVGLFALAAGSLALSLPRYSLWNSPADLVAATLEENPAALSAWNIQGRLQLEAHSTRGELDDLRAASSSFATALQLCIEARDRTERDFVGKRGVLEANLGQGWCELRLSEIDGFDDASAALAVFEQLSANYTNVAEAQVGLGLAQMAMGQDAEAVDSLRKAIDLEPNNPGAHANLGRLHYRAGRFDDARRHLDRAVELSAADDANVRLWAARANFEAGRLRQATELAQASSTLNPSSPEPWVVLGGVALKEQDPDRALTHFGRALSIDDRYALAHDGRGRALMLRGKPSEALLAWRRACDFGTDLFEPHYNVASLLLARKLDTEALPYLRRAYELAPDADTRSALRGTLATGLDASSLANLELATLDNRRGDLEAARSWAARYTQAAPEDAAGWILAGQLATRAGQAPIALEYLDRARSMGAESLGLWLDIARARSLAGDSTGAAEALDAARSAMPDLSQQPQLEAVLNAQIDQLEKLLQQGPLPAAGN